jgi:hypothetical protein
MNYDVVTKYQLEAVRSKAVVDHPEEHRMMQDIEDRYIYLVLSLLNKLVKVEILS